MGRRDYKGTRRPQQEGQATKPRKGGGLGTGLFAGVILGMAIAGGMYWYLNSQPSGLKSPEPVGDVALKEAPAEIQPPPGKVMKPSPEPLPEPPAPPPPEPEPTPARREPIAKPPPQPKPAPANVADVKKKTVPPPANEKKPPNADYSFYDILPGNATPKPKPAPRAVELHWLQVAALRAPEDAERLKARLSLLGLPVVVQKIDSAGQTLHRIRVGPYKSEDDGLGALDTLAENNFEPRWVKDPVTP
jgi:cell division septation protein DedD